MSVTINGTTGLAGVDGSAGTPAVQGSDTNTGVFFPAADTVGVTTGGSERMRIDSSGNVGIGTASPVANANQKSVTINGTNFSRVDFQVGGSSTAYIYSGTSNTNLGTSGSTFIAFDTNSTERMRIDSSGNVGIGTTNPQAKLHVNTASAALYLGYGANFDNYFQTNNNTYFTNYNGSTEFARIDSTGVFFMNSGYGSSAKAYGCRAWVSFNGTSGALYGTPGNVTSVTRSATGRYTVNLTNAQPDTNYAILATIKQNGTNNNQRIYESSTVTKTTSAYGLATDDGASYSDFNPVYSCIIR